MVQYWYCKIQNERQDERRCWEMYDSRYVPTYSLSELRKENQRTFYRKEKCWVLIYVW